RSERGQLHVPIRRAAAQRQAVLAPAVFGVGARALRVRRDRTQDGGSTHQCAGRWLLTVLWRGSLVVLLTASLFALPRAAEPLWDTGTFSILGFDPQTGEVGGAVQSRVFSVGNGVLWADADAGVAATQAIVDVGYGPRAIELLRKHTKPAAIISQILKEDRDPLPENWTKEGRQFAVMNLKGEYAAHTGSKATEWAGNKGGKFATAQGNILAGPAVVDNMIDA